MSFHSRIEGYQSGRAMTRGRRLETDHRVLVGDARAALRTLDAESVDCVVTSPPYLGLRDYGHEGQIGREGSVGEYVAALVEVFAEVHRALRPEGTVWLNLGDAYAGSGKGAGSGMQTNNKGACIAPVRVSGLKPKDLMLVPARTAIALQEWGWWVRSEVVWAKPNPMPESVKDRPSTAHEHIWMLTKSARHYYNNGEGQVPIADSTIVSANAAARRIAEGEDRARAKIAALGTRRLRNYEDAPLEVWRLSPTQFSGAHFATFPATLVERCLAVGCPAGGTVLDPFAGAGTVGLVADRLGYEAVLCELNETYADMAIERIESEAPLTAQVTKEIVQQNLFGEEA